MDFTHPAGAVIGVLGVGHLRAHWQLVRGSVSSEPGTGLGTEGGFLSAVVEIHPTPPFIAHRAARSAAGRPRSRDCRADTQAADRPGNRNGHSPQTYSRYHQAPETSTPPPHHTLSTP